MSLSKASTLSDEESTTPNYVSVCGICLSAYEVPKGLPCLHSFCLGCIREWASQASSSAASVGRVVSCPNCRKDCVLPASGVDGLPTNFYITERNQVERAPVCNSCENRNHEIVARCRECGFVCSDCARSHTTMRSLKTHSVIKLDYLRVGKTGKQLARLGIESIGSRREPGSGIFKLEKTIYLNLSYYAWCCTITSASAFEVAVPDHSGQSGKVHVFGIDGKVKLKIDTKKGLIPGQSSSPFAVATTSDGNFCMTDANARVKIHDKCGNFLSQIQLIDRYGVSCTSGEAKGLAIDSNGQIIVGDIKTKDISIYKNDKTFVNAFGVSIEPEYIAVKPGEDESLLINGINTQTILEVDYSGNVLRTVKPPATDVEWKFRGLCCSKLGEIFVVNAAAGHGCVCRFSNTWQYTGCVIPDLEYPRGIAISEDGQLLAVIDTNTKLKIFRRA